MMKNWILKLNAEIEKLNKNCDILKMYTMSQKHGTQLLFVSLSDHDQFL